MSRARAVLVLALVLAPAADAGARERARRSGTTVLATYQGFHATDDGGELYMQLDRAPRSPQVKTTRRTVDLVLPGTRAAKRFRRLETRYFPTIVQSVETRRKGKNLVVHVTLKEPCTPKLDVREDKGVTTVALLFPPGKPAAGAPPRPAGG